MVSHILLYDNNSTTLTELAAVIKPELSATFLHTNSADEAQDICSRYQVAVLFFHLNVGDNYRDELELLRQLRKLNDNTVVVLLVADGCNASAKEILQSGAHFFLHAPFSNEEIVRTANSAFQHYMLQQSTPSAARNKECLGIIGQSDPMQRLFTLIDRLGGDGDSTVLIQGESGTGKELVAKALHLRSPRRHNNFVTINCAAIPAELLESELFGYHKGAFTGAVNNKKGRLQYADGGTLFLDEIGDMNPALQAKLLRVIQEQEFDPVGSVKSITVNVRFVAATHRNLEEAVAKGNFREDLYYRLSVVPLEIPPLRERKDDIPLLLETFTQRFCTSKKRNVFTFSPQAIEYLTRYPWPGNVRELENLVQRLSILHMEDVVEPHDLPAKYLNDLPFADGNTIVNGIGTDFNSRVSEFEDRLILQALIQARGNKKEAAELLNLKRTTLLEKIKKKQLDKALQNLRK